MLEVKNLSLRGVLKRVTFSVENGKVACLVGKNGAGKTTLLKCVGGYYRYSGRILLNGEEIKKVPLRKRIKLVNYLPQSIEVLFPYTLKEFLLASVPFKVDEEAVRRVLKRLRIYHLKDRPFKVLSGGEKVKTLIARLLLIDPEVYLFDEPSAFLDVEVLPTLADIVLELKSKGKIVLITSHDLNFLVDLCDLFLGLKGGELLFCGGREVFLENLEKLYDAELNVFHFAGETFIKPTLREVKG